MKFNPYVFFEKTNRLKAILIVFGVLCVGLFIIDFFVERYTYFDVEGLYNFYSIYGFVMFSIIIFGSRFLRFLLGRPENYYDKKAVDSEDYPNMGEK
tara:strand:- start:100 stop:390 length:291 start_codon:yes stop_codon:yes gene_type:complete